MGVHLTNFSDAFSWSSLSLGSTDSPYTMLAWFCQTESTAGNNIFSVFDQESDDWNMQVRSGDQLRFTDFVSPTDSGRLANETNAALESGGSLYFGACSTTGTSSASRKVRLHALHPNGTTESSTNTGSGFNDSHSAFSQIQVTRNNAGTQWFQAALIGQVLSDDFIDGIFRHRRSIAGGIPGTLFYVDLFKKAGYVSNLGPASVNDVGITDSPLHAPLTRPILIPVGVPAPTGAAVPLTGTVSPTSDSASDPSLTTDVPVAGTVSPTSDSANDPTLDSPSTLVVWMNATAIQTATATGSWGTLTDFAVTDGAAGTNIIWWGSLSSSVAPTSGQFVEMAAGDLLVQLDNAGYDGSTKGGLMEAGAQRVIDQTFGDPDISHTLYAGLLTALPATWDAAGTEANYTSYARQALTAGSWSAAAAGSTTYNATISFPVNTGTSQTVVGLGLWDASVAGTLLYAIPVTSLDVDPAVAPEVTSGTLTLKILD